MPNQMKEKVFSRDFPLRKNFDKFKIAARLHSLSRLHTLDKNLLQPDRFRH